MTDAKERAREIGACAGENVQKCLEPGSIVYAEHSHDVKTVGWVHCDLHRKIAAALAAEREEAEQETRKDVAQFVRECLQEHVGEWVIGLVEQGVRMRRPANGGEEK